MDGSGDQHRARRIDTGQRRMGGIGRDRAMVMAGFGELVRTMIVGIIGSIGDGLAVLRHLMRRVGLADVQSAEQDRDGEQDREQTTHRDGI